VKRHENRRNMVDDHDKTREYLELERGQSLFVCHGSAPPFPQYTTSSARKRLFPAPLRAQKNRHGQNAVPVLPGGGGMDPPVGRIYFFLTAPSLMMSQFL